MVPKCFAAFQMLLFLLLAVVPVVETDEGALTRNKSSSPLAATTKTNEKKSGQSSQPLNILMVASGSKYQYSHLNYAANIARALSRQHNVHLLVVMKVPETANLKFDQVEGGGYPVHVHYYMPTTDPDFVQYMLEADRKQRGMGFWAVFKRMLDPTVEDETMELLRSIHFDVGIAEMSRMNQYAFALFHAFGIQNTVTIKAYTLSPRELHDLTDEEGKPLELYAKIAAHPAPMPPIHGTKIGDNDFVKRSHPIRRQRIHSMHLDHVETKTKEFAPMDQQFKHIQFPGLRAMYRQSKFYFMNSQPEIEWDDGEIFADVSKVKMIGGIHFKPNPGKIDPSIDERLRALESELQQQNNAQKLHAKLVLVSFGTVAGMTTNHQFDPMLRAIQRFARLHREFLFVWKLDKNDTRIGQINGEEALGNVLATDWIDQQAILADPRTKAFMSHCGRNSELEAVYHGVPLICVPQDGDQTYNAESLAKNRIAIVLNKKKTERELEMRREMSSRMRSWYSVESLTPVERAEVAKETQEDWEYIWSLKEAMDRAEESGNAEEKKALRKQLRKAEKTFGRHNALTEDSICNALAEVLWLPAGCNGTDLFFQRRINMHAVADAAARMQARFSGGGSPADVVLDAMAEIGKQMRKKKNGNWVKKGLKGILRLVTQQKRKI